MTAGIQNRSQLNSGTKSLVENCGPLPNKTATIAVATPFSEAGSEQSGIDRAHSWRSYLNFDEVPMIGIQDVIVLFGNDHTGHGQNRAACG